MYAKHLRRTLVVLVAVGAIAATVTASAQAVQIYGVYAPQDHGSYVQGWANIRTDCPYFQCSVYLKIERSSWSGWRFVNGSFVNWSNSWISMSAGKLSGCYDYRTTIELYEDSIGPVAGGVNIGPVGTSASGQTIYRWNIGPWSSGTTRACA